MRILLCEDDSNIATIARFALEQVGHHQVTWARDGEQALQIGTSESFDVILLDEMMPKMSGVAVCAEFVKKTPNVGPVIFMSANPQEKRVEEFKQIAIGFIPKPFDPMKINEQIESLLAARLKKAI
jgi:two-component system alkaline phosphatase synthesis response regulator PhoP